MLCKYMSDDLHSLFFWCYNQFYKHFCLSALVFPSENINWKSTIRMMNSVSSQTSCGFLVDSPLELSGHEDSTSLPLS